MFATGSEVQIAIDAAGLLPELNIRIVSVFCREMLYEAWEKNRQHWRPGSSRTFAIEAASRSGWEVFTDGERSRVIGLDDFGASGRPEEVAEHVGFTPEKFAELIRTRTAAG